MAAASDPWWIVREGELGQIVSSFTPSQLFNLSVQWTATQNPVRPNATAMGPYPTQAAAKAAADKENASEAGLNKAAAAAVASATGTNGLAGFIAALSEPDTWIRVAKVLAGGVLLIIGLAHMTGADNAVGKIARSVPVPV